MIDQILQQLAAFLANIYNGLTNWLASLVSSIVEWVSGVVAYISNAIVSAMSALKSFLESFAAQLKGFFDGLLKAVADTFVNAWTKAVGGLLQVIDNLRLWLAQLIDNFRAIVGGIMEGISSAFSTVRDKVVELVLVGVNTIKDFVATVGTKIAEFLRPILDAIVNFIRDISGAVVQAIDKILGATDSLIEGVNARLQDIKQGFADAAADVVKGLTNLSDETFKPIKDLIEEYVQRFGESLSPESAAKLTSAFKSWTSGNSLELYSREEAQNYWTSHLPQDKVGRWVFLLASQVMAFMVTFHGVAQANSEVILQEFAANYPYKLLPPADVAAAWRKGRIPEGTAKSILRRQGYSDADADVILDITQNTPAVGDLLAAWHRKLIDDRTVDRGLNQLGLQEPYVKMVKDLSFLIPPVQDIITMAVREVFSPETANRFQQFSEFPEDFAKWAEAQGLSREWARNYWAAHWALPSVEMGFEMVHRKAIEPTDLDLLLKAHDVMPFWREPLKKITYLTMTRVDIRRVHQMGLIDEDGVLKAHLDLGYSPETAKILTDFTVGLNKNRPSVNDEELGKLTRDSILGFYSDGLLTVERAFQLLTGLGMPADAAQLYIQAADLDAERARRKEVTQLVVDRYAAGAVTFEQAQQQLSQLNLTAREIDRATVQLVQLRDKGTKLPSRTEAESMLEAGIITPAMYRDVLSRLGFAPVWAEAFVKLWEKKHGASKG